MVRAAGWPGSQLMGEGLGSGQSLARLHPGESGEGVENSEWGWGWGARLLRAPSLSFDVETLLLVGGCPSGSA